MKDEVIVLGCGPAGLLAAHAVNMCGREPVVLSRKVRSPIGGAQFLHEPIPHVARKEDAETVRFVKRGSAAIYAKKIYGDMAAPTSWDGYEEGEHTVWNMRRAYGILWEMYSGCIVEEEVTPGMVEGLASQGDMVISSIPLRATCPDPQDYEWKSQTVWIEYGTDVHTEADDMEIIYNGRSGSAWYRASNLFGWKGVEWSEPIEGAVEITKPLYSSFPGVVGVLNVGRYGQWKKGVLVHDAYNDVMDYFTEMDYHG